MTIKIIKKADNLKKYIERAEELGGTHKVPFTELFPDSFMKAYTDFNSFQEMFDASGIENAEEIKGEKWSNFVAQRSRFKGWDAMYAQAGSEWMKRKLTL